MLICWCMLSHPDREIPESWSCSSVREMLHHSSKWLLQSKLTAGFLVNSTWLQTSTIPGSSVSVSVFWDFVGVFKRPRSKTFYLIYIYIYFILFYFIRCAQSLGSFGPVNLQLTRHDMWSANLLWDLGAYVCVDELLMGGFCNSTHW